MGTIVPSFRPGRTKETILGLVISFGSRVGGIAWFLSPALVLTTLLVPAACPSPAIPVPCSRFPVGVNWVHSAAPSGASPIHLLEDILLLPRETQWEYLYPRAAPRSRAVMLVTKKNMVGPLRRTHSQEKKSRIISVPV